MSMICYTRNFEDVIIQRVFADIQGGHFLDVGASAPVSDSNTYALYEKGWRGIAVEPLPYYTEEWKRMRPEDLYLQGAVGAAPGLLNLSVFHDRQQLSTGSVETAAHWQRHKVTPTHTLQVQQFTLNQIFETYLASRPLHLLSLDVEGMEGEALRGLNLRLHRPWLIVVEAVMPGAPVPTHQAWEPAILAADYLLTYFDGVNRFYLANEHRELAAKFATPPNVWDFFTTATQRDLETQVKMLEARVRALTSANQGRVS